MPIQFGAPSAMSTHGGSSSNSKGECKECVRLYRKGHFNARKPKFCDRHQCPRTDPAGIVCTKRKRADDTHCRTHTQCTVIDCRNPRAGILNEYCENHTCIFEGCDEGRAHDPSRRLYDDLCSAHLSKVCKIPTCRGLQFEEGGNYCLRHTCEVCNEKNLNETGRPFCVEHNKCSQEGCGKPRCQFGNGFEDVCREHYIPPCRVESCDLQSSPATRYCDLHSCRYASHDRCKKEARPGRGKPFCADHKCSDIDCQFLRSFNEREGVLRMNDFCPRHECGEKTCMKHTIPENRFCNSHCCTDQRCTEARDHDPRCGTLCHAHYEEKIAKRAVDERLAEQLEQIRLKEAQQTAHAAAEQARREALRREEDRRERRQPPADRGRGPELPRRPARSPPRRQYGDQEGLWPKPEQPFDRDEGYRSNRSSGDSFGAHNGW